MENKDFNNQKKYNSSLYLLNNLQEKKLINTKEYDRAKKLFVKKYKPINLS